MILTKEYLSEQEDCIKRNFDVHISWGNNPYIRDRYMALRDFIAPGKTSISIGSGGVEAHAIHATHALDVHPVAHELLKSIGWKGIFKLGSCTFIPYPDKSFDYAVCSEVIEHLPTLDDVRKTFLEINRIAKRWMVTTPAIDVHEKTHKFLFTINDLYNLAGDLDVKINRRGIFYYVTKE